MDFAALSQGVMQAFREAEPVLYQPRGAGPPFDVPGILDRYVVEVPSPDEGPPTWVPRATLSVRAADLPPHYLPAAEDRVRLRGITFDVKDAPEADCTGWIVLRLGRVG